MILCPVLGPSAVVVLHRLSRYASTGPTQWQPAVLAATFGLSRNAATGLAPRTVARLARFGFVAIGTSTLAVRTHVPPFPRRWLDTLPDYLRQEPTTTLRATVNPAEPPEMMSHIATRAATRPDQR